MRQLPIFLDIAGRPCLVVGGGEVAARKVALLLAAGALVTVVAPDLCPTLAGRVAEGTLQHRARHFDDGDLDDVILVIAATNDRAVNAHISALAQARKQPVNVVDDPELCSFTMPAIVDRDPITIAISTGGSSPILARLLRTRLESLIPAGLSNLAQLAARWRERVQEALPTTARRPFWERILQGPVAELAVSGRTDQADAALAEALTTSRAPATTPIGEVFLVGAGPGHPDLLTFAALHLMQQADVVLHDALVPDAILDRVRRDAERIPVGKRGADHTLPQEEINARLVALARAGKNVLRLKGGDPYLFGRGAEEIETLVGAGIRFQVVPGVTAASGAAAYAGIPLTHRDHADQCTFVTGHHRNGELDLDWPALTRSRQTVVVYMGLKGIDALCQQLIAHGRSPDTPAAVIGRATQAGQRTVTGTLASLPDAARLNPPPTPALIIIGDVVACRGALDWRDAG